MSEHQQTSKDSEAFKNLKYNKSHRIKPIYLELNGYTINHQPIQEDNSSRFIGRKAIVDKIRSFIMDSSSNTGAYLITGYRGMGKTSLVNTALDMLNPKSGIKRYVYLWLVSLLVLFDVSITDTKSFVFTSNYIMAFGLFWILALAILVFFSYREVRKEKKQKIISWSFGKDLLGLIMFAKLKKYRDLNYRTYRRIAFGILWVLGLFIFDYKALGQNATTSSVFYTNILLLFHIFMFRTFFTKWIRGASFSDLNISLGASLFFILMSFLSLYFIFSMHIQKAWMFNILYLFLCTYISYFLNKKQMEKKQKNKTYEDPFSKITNHISFYRHLIIRINLGKDNLTEKDVLKYMVDGLIKEYKIWKKHYGINRLTNLLLPYIIFYLLLILFMNRTGYNRINHEIYSEYGITAFFPSQNNLDSTQMVLFKQSINSNKINSLGDYIQVCEGDTICRSTQKNSGGYKNLADGPIKKIAHFSNILDFYIVVFYDFWAKTLFGGIRDKNPIKTLFPTKPDYFTFGLLLLVPFLLRRTDIPWRQGVMTHSKQLRDLEKLREKIHASVIIDKGANIPATKSISEKISLFTTKKRSEYAPLDSKDIEAKLLRILANNTKIPIFSARLRFIFVFDELDKIAPHTNKTLIEKEGENLTQKNVNVQLKRQETISAILSGLKNLLNTAQAKFIFIAGRDMYDAALAGVSDRESILDSIFHDNKIYVNSFYSEMDDDAINDITSMTEQFLCRYLIPSHGKYGNLDKSLPSYSKYLYELSEKKQISKEAIPKILATVKDFIVYITYRSNGAPKKITTILEQFCVPGSIDRMDKKDIILVSNNAKNMHLKLNFYDQYRASYTSYLVTPIFLELGNYIAEFGDKLLVSISYLLDHLFKYHKFGFSSRNLALTPEIVDINKEPQFRRFLSNLITFLSSSHIRAIISGLYEYKFDSRTKIEVDFLSRISEIESAAYNFTLDESIELKRYFYSKLELIRKNYSKNVGYQVNKDYINSIAMFHSLLGDMHFYDQEFGEAILNYLEAVQAINNLPIEELDPYLLVLSVRDNLKLGLAYEKEPKNKQALMKYSQTANFVVKKREIALQSIGLCYFVITKKDFQTLFVRPRNHNIEQLKKVYKWAKGEPLTEENEFKKLENFLFGKDCLESIIIGRPKEAPQTNEDWNKFHPFSNLAQFYDTNGEYLAKNYTKLKLKTNPVLANYQLLTTENIRLLYQPLIAKLYLIEKTTPDGVVRKDIMRVVEEFNFLTRPVNKSEKIIISSEFYNKLGDLMFYKNGSLYGLEPEIEPKIEPKNKELLNLIKSRYNDLPIDALLFYIKSVTKLISPDDKKWTSDRTWEQTFIFSKTTKATTIIQEIGDFLKLIQDRKIDQNVVGLVNSTNFLIDLANGLVDTADTLLCFSENKLLQEPIENIYRKAADLFQKTSSFRLARYCLTNIIYLRKIEDEPLSPNSNLINESLELIYTSHRDFTRPEIKKMRGIISKDHKVRDGLEPLQVYPYTSIMAEIKEVVLLELYIQLDSLKNNNKHLDDDSNTIDLLSKIYNTVNPYSMVSTKYNRVLELNLRVDANKLLYKKLLYIKSSNTKATFPIAIKKVTSGITSKIFSIKGGDIEDTELKHFLIADSIGCLSEIIKTHELFGTNYVSTTNSVLARAHHKMEFWTDQYQTRVEDYETKNKTKALEKLNELIRDFIGSDRLYYISPKFHKSKSNEYNRKIDQMHRRGTEYMNFIKTKFYLDDDFNDHPVHFATAVERYVWLHKGNRFEAVNHTWKIYCSENYLSQATTSGD